jgi:hypothetical protein
MAVLMRASRIAKWVGCLFFALAAVFVLVNSLPKRDDHGGGRPFTAEEAEKAQERWRVSIAPHASR